MAWLTTKDGRRVNTDWFDDDEKKKYAQLENNAEQAFALNQRMNIPYDQWKHEEDKHTARGTEKPYDVYERDETRYIHEKDIRKVTKKSTMEEVEVWRNDDGTYGTGDESIYIFYDNGKFVDLTDGEVHERWSKQGVRGISISTGDYQQVWGEEYYPKTKEWKPIQTDEFDEDSNPIDGYSNSYSGYKATGVYNVRQQETIFLNDRNRWEKKYTTLKMSTVHRIGGDNNQTANSPSVRMSNLLAKKGISTSWEIENYLRNLSPTRRSRLAKEMGIDLRGEDKIKMMAQKIFAAGKN